MAYLLDADVFIRTKNGIKCMTPYEMLRRERARLGRSEAGSPNDSEELA